MHLNELHSDAEFLGTVVTRPKCYRLLQKFIRYEWSANWRPCDRHQHIALLDLKSRYSVLGYPVMPFSLFIQQIGPANVHLKISIEFFGQINGIIIQTITPLAPMRNKIVHHFYTEPTLKAFLFSKFMIYGEAKMVWLVGVTNGCFASVILGQIMMRKIFSFYLSSFIGNKKSII